ncbi:MAG: EF-hand domain-containing protein [Alphaproteobacteria bacterium]|nr:EF-hand domain-containing protein [Alphaproteobacteria bacterium]
MKKTHLALALGGTAAVAMLVAGIAFADPPHRGRGPHMDMGGRITERFAEVDADKNGVVTKAEVDAARAARFAETDTDKDGKISREEFDAHIEKQEKERRDRMFSMLDDNEDGSLTPDEQGMRDEKGLMRFDTDNNGEVTKAELDAGMAKLRDRGPGHGPRDGMGPKGGTPDPQ